MSQLFTSGVWLHPFILSGVISPLISSSILGTYRPGLLTPWNFPGLAGYPLPLPSPASFCTPRPNLPITPGFLTSYFCIPVPCNEKNDRMWSTGEGNGKPFQYSCLENPINSMKRQKDELSRSVGAQYATGDQWRNN